MNYELLRFDRRIFRRTWMIVVLINFPLFSAVYGQNAKEIVERYNDAVTKGDFNRWEKITSAYIESNMADTFEGLIMQKNKRKTGKMYRVWPDKSMSELFHDSTLVSVTYHVKGKHTLVMVGQGTVPTNPGPYEPYFEFDPVLIKKIIAKSRSIEVVGIKIFDAVKCFDVKIDAKSLVWNFYFNVDTYLLEYWSNAPENSSSSTLTKVYDYKDFDGYLIPMSETKFNNGVPFFWSTITRLELNKEIDPKKFELVKQ